MNKKTLLGVLLTLTCIAAFAKWDVAGGNDGSTLYVDRSTIRKSGSLVKMWVLMDEKSSQVVEGKTVQSSKSQDEFDCKNELTRTRHLIVYSRRMGDGDVVYTSSKVQEWQAIPPGTIVESMWKVACGK